jgi:hypothetical protein
MDGYNYPVPRLREGRGDAPRYRSLSIAALWVVLQFGAIVMLNRAGVPVWQDVSPAAVSP